MSRAVETSFGKLEGLEVGSHLQFRGIPYAAPPTGNRRFAAPGPVSPWSGTRLAQTFPVAAPQEKLSLFGVDTIGDDCLYLNVWAPKNESQKRPVMVWFHGGAFSSGTSSQIMYHGDRLVEFGDVVLVTANYRLGAMGFVNLQDRLGSDNFSTNNGLRDQVAALQWVRDNIEAFGGDAGNVTIFGESAGGMSVATLMAVPSARGLFHKVICQSGSADHVLSREDSVKVADSFLDAMGVSGEENSRILFECEPQDLVKAQRSCATQIVHRGVNGCLPMTGMTMIPVVDGDFLPGHPVSMIENGSADEVALMAGSNRDEWNLFIFNPFFNGGGDASKWKDIPRDKCLRMIDRLLPGRAEEAFDLYSEFSGEKGLGDAEVFAAIETDRTFRIPTLRLLDAHSRRQEKCFNYMLTWKTPAFDGVLGSCHVVDIPLVFGNVDDPIGNLFTGGGKAAADLSQQMMRSWVNFARESSPACGQFSDWENWSKGTNTMVMGAESGQVQDWQGRHNAFWEGII